MAKVKLFSISFLIFFLFVTNLPHQALSPDHSTIFLFTPLSDLYFSSMVHYRIISSENFLNKTITLRIKGDNYFYQKNIRLVSPVENMYQDISKFPAGNYKCYITQESSFHEALSNSLIISIKASPPNLKLKEWPETGIKKVTSPNLLIEAFSSEKLKQVSLFVDNRVICMEDYGFTWKWDGFLPLKNGINEIVLMGINDHDVTSRKLYKISLEQPIMASRVPVLVYHNIGYMNGSFNVTPEVFESQIKELVKNGCYFTEPSEIDLFFHNKKDLPEKSIMITFDDGYRGVLQYALPVLKKYNIKATLFLITGYLGNTSFLNWDHVDELIDSGLFTLGSHTHNLHYYEKFISFPVNTPALLRFKLKGETKSLYSKRIIEDLEKSKKLIETRYKKEVICFAYPFGAYNEEAIILVKQCGFKLAFAYNSQQVKWITKNSNQFLLERYPVFQYSTNTDLFMEEK